MNGTTSRIDSSFNSVTNWNEQELDYNTQIQLFLNNPAFLTVIESREDTALIATDDECLMDIPSDVKNVYFKAGSCANVVDLELGGFPDAKNIIFGKGSFNNVKTVYLHGVSHQSTVMPRYTC